MTPVPTVRRGLTCEDVPTSASTCEDALEVCFACAACCDGAQAAAARDADSNVEYACVTTAEGFGRTCGFSGYFTCGCKAGARAATTTLCAGQDWALDAAAQCHAIGASREDYF